MYYNSLNRDIQTCMGNPEAMSLVSCEVAQVWEWHGNKLRAVGTSQCMSVRDVDNVKRSSPILADCDPNDSAQAFTYVQYDDNTIAIGHTNSRYLETVNTIISESFPDSF